MKAGHKKSVMKIVATGVLLALVGCGSDKDGGSSNAPAQQAPQLTEPKDGDEKPKSGTIEDGKYYLSSGSYEGSDTAGNKIDPQTLQIAGDYYWEMKHQSDDRYEVTATGRAKLSSDNNILAEVNCAGSQDVYSFEMISSGSLRNFAQLEAGCPQAAKLTSSQQMSIRSLNANAFEYTVVTQNDGVRIVETFVFRK